MKDTSGRTWTPVPPWLMPSRIQTGTLSGVWLRDNESVDWHTMVMPGGSMHVYGFTITSHAKTYPAPVAEGTRQQPSKLHHAGSSPAGRIGF